MSGVDSKRSSKVTKLTHILLVENFQLHSKGFVLLCDCVLYYILQEGCFFKQEETKQLCAKSDDKNFKGVDMLLTSDWPKDVTQYGNKLVCIL